MIDYQFVKYHKVINNMEKGKVHHITASTATFTEFERLADSYGLTNKGVADTFGVYPPSKAVNRLYIKNLPRKFMPLTFVLASK